MSWTLVTGGAKGLGAEICKRLAEREHNILVHYNTSLNSAEETVKYCRKYGVKAEMIHGDFSSETSVEKFTTELQAGYDSISVLINNVGNYSNKPLLETSYEEWQTLMQVNFLAPMMLIGKLLPGIKSAQGSIINIGVSGLTAMRSNISNTAYGMTKLNLWMATRSLAKDLACENVRVNMVSPGQLENSVDRPADQKRLPMQRLGTLQEVAGTVAYLLNKESAYITGQNIEVAGGLGL